MHFSIRRIIQGQLSAIPFSLFFNARCMRALLAISLMLPILSARLLAQISGAGTIQGSVSDLTGAVISGAQVKVLAVRTNEEHDQNTTSSGFYSFGGLQPGLYSITVSANGFQTYTQQNISLDALQTFGVNVKMKIGGADTNITVTDAPAPLDTANATLGSSMEVDTYKALPLILGGQPRDPTAFIYLTPGVTGGGGVNQMNGGQSNLNETYIDGVAMDDVNQQGDWAVVHSTFSVDAVDQFQVQTSGVSAAYQGQGLQNFVHKSGTNQYHGSVFEYFRNTVLDTWGFYAPATINAVTGTAIKPIEHQNEFGGTFGGYVPRFKNKIFFFGSFDDDHYLHGTNPSYTTVPTALERTGNFTDLPAGQSIYDPTTTNCSTNPCTRTQFSYQGTANVIAPSRISPVSKYMQSFLPPPSNASLTNNYLGGFNTGFNYPRQSYKVDLNLIRNHTISLLVVEGGRYPNPACCDASGLPLPYLTTVGNTQNNLTALASDTWTINSRTVNKLNYAASLGAFHGVGNTNPTEANPAWYATAAGITNIPPGQASNSFPSTSFAGPNAPLGWATNDRAATGGDVAVYHLQDGLQILKGRHSLSIGGEYQWEESNSVSLDTGTYLSLSYSNNETAGFTGQTINTKQGAAYASYILGSLDSASVTDSRPVEKLYGRYHNFSPYVQDDIKATRRLTLNVGLRWDVYSPYTEKENRFSFVNLGIANPVTGIPGALQYGGPGPSPTYCNCTTPDINIWYKNLGPRLGFAYAIDSKTVVRGSYGIYYSHAGGVGGRVNASGGVGQAGFSGGASFSTPDGGITPGLYLNSTNTAIPSYTLPPTIDPGYGTGFTTNPNYASLSPNTVNYADPYLSRRAPYYQNFNFGLQREIFKQTVLSADYSASTGHFLGTSIGRGIYSNQLNPSTYVLAGLLTQKATPANVQAAQKILPSFQLPFANFSPNATIAQALRPFPQFNGFSDIWGDVGNSNYHSLQIQLKQAFQHGFSYNLSYTWSKSLDDTGASRSAYGVNGVPASYLEYGLSATDIPNHVSFYGVYNLPFGQSGGHRFTNAIIKNFSVSGIFHYQSGTPITVTATGCNAPNSGTCYPNIAPGYNHSPRINGGWGRKNTAANSPSMLYIDTAAFTIPAAYTFGNAPRSYTLGLRNPGGYEEDLSIRRTFGIFERLKFTFEGSLFNLDNHVDFSGPSTVFGSSSFGTVTGQANTSRDAQFSGRLEF
jgi:hypothetical protein